MDKIFKKINFIPFDSSFLRFFFCTSDDLVAYSANKLRPLFVE